MWSEDKSLGLIEIYKSKPVLWNPKDPKYYRKHLKNEAWEEIADSVKMDLEICKSKMISLLASFRREKGKMRKRQAIAKGNVEVVKSMWFAYDALTFLDGRNNQRKRLNSMIPDDSIVEDIVSAEHPKQIEFNVHSSRLPNSKKRCREEAPASDENKKTDMLSEALDILRNVSMQNESNYINDMVDDECVHFGNFIASKMKKYPESTKTAVQRAITNVLFKADDGYYDCPRPHTKTTAPSPSYTTSSQPSPAESQQSVDIDELV